MNPRLLVSILFVLLAVTAFRPEANEAFKRLKTLQHAWEDKVHDRNAAAEILNRIGSRVSALKSEFHGRKDRATPIRPRGDRLEPAGHCAPENQRCRVGSLLPGSPTITSGFSDNANVPSWQEKHLQRRVMNLIDSGRHTAVVERVTTAVRQIHEVLDLMCAK